MVMVRAQLNLINRPLSFHSPPTATIKRTTHTNQPKQIPRTDDEEVLPHAVHRQHAIRLHELAGGVGGHAPQQRHVEAGAVLEPEEGGVDPDAPGEGDLAGQHLFSVCLFFFLMGGRLLEDGGWTDSVLCVVHDLFGETETRVCVCPSIHTKHARTKTSPPR